MILLQHWHFSSDGTRLAVGSERKIRLLGSSKQPRLKDGPRGTKSLAFSPDDTVLVAGLRNGGIELFDMTTGEKTTTLNGHTAIVEVLVFSPDGEKLSSARDRMALFSYGTGMKPSRARLKQINNNKIVFSAQLSVKNLAVVGKTYFSVTMN